MILISLFISFTLPIPKKYHSLKYQKISYQTNKRNEKKIEHVLDSSQNDHFDQSDASNIEPTFSNSNPLISTFSSQLTPDQSQGKDTNYESNINLETSFHSTDIDSDFSSSSSNTLYTEIYNTTEISISENASENSKEESSSLSATISSSEVDTNNLESESPSYNQIQTKIHSIPPTKIETESSLDSFHIQPTLTTATDISTTSNAYTTQSSIESEDEVSSSDLYQIQTTSSLSAETDTKAESSDLYQIQTSSSLSAETDTKAESSDFYTTQTQSSLATETKTTTLTSDFNPTESPTQMPKETETKLMITFKAPTDTNEGIYFPSDSRQTHSESGNENSKHPGFVSHYGEIVLLICAVIIIVLILFLIVLVIKRKRARAIVDDEYHADEPLLMPGEFV